MPTCGPSWFVSSNWANKNPEKTATCFKTGLETIAMVRPAKTIAAVYVLCSSTCTNVCMYRCRFQKIILAAFRPLILPAELLIPRRFNRNFNSNTNILYSTQPLSLGQPPPAAFISLCKSPLSASAGRYHGAWCGRSLGMGWSPNHICMFSFCPFPFSSFSLLSLPSWLITPN